MCTILLSINPEHVENILHGRKIYEFRKQSCKRRVNKIIIYSTAPVKKVVGEVEVLDILEMDKQKLWNITKKEAGISKEFFDLYYVNKKTAVAYKLGNVIEYERPKSLEELGIKMAPQSFVYMT